MGKHISDHIKVIFFDFDDTLVGTIGTKWEQHKFVAREHYGKELTDEEIEMHWGKPLEELVCLLYDTDDAKQAIAHNTAHHKDYPKDLFKASIPTLKQLKETGKLIGIITATSRFSLEHDLKLHRFPQEIIDYTQAADDTSSHKPDPAVFEPALAWLKERQVLPEEVIYVGDSLHDMNAAVGAGFNFVGVETGLVGAEDFRNTGTKSLPSVGHLTT